MPRRTVFLHIGIEKTGSSALQWLGAMNRAAFAAQGLLYPQSPIYPQTQGGRAHRALAAFITSGDKLRELGLPDSIQTEAGLAAFRADTAARLAEEVAASGLNRIWLSSEHLAARCEDAAGPARLADALRLLNADVQVIIYLRHQAELYLSSLSTAIKAGSGALRPPPQRADAAFYDFEALLARYAAAFGREAIRLRIYHPQSLRGGDIVSDFLGVINEPRPEALRLPPKLNARLGAEALALLRHANKIGATLAENGRRDPRLVSLTNALMALPGRTPLGLPAETLAAIDTLFAAANQRIADQYFADGRPLFPPPAVPIGEVPAQIDRDSAIRLLLQAWIAREALLTGPARERARSLAGPSGEAGG